MDEAFLLAACGCSILRCSCLAFLLVILLGFRVIFFILTLPSPRKERNLW